MTKETKNLGTLLADKDSESIVSMFEQCCTRRRKTLLDAKSIKDMYILGAVNFSVEQLTKIQNYANQAANFLNKKKTLREYADIYEQIDTYVYHLIAMERAKNLGKTRKLIRD